MKQNLTSFASVVAIACGSFFAAGCDDSEEKLKTFVPICERSTESLASSADLDGDSFMQVLDNAIKSCSAACDYEHKASCTMLSDQLEKLCTVEASVCDSFCSTGKGSLKTASCKLSKKS